MRFLAVHRVHGVHGVDVQAVEGVRRGGRDKEGYDDDDDDLCRYLHNITSLCRPPLLPAGWMLTPGLCAATDWWPD